jgi:hypothetical protein
MAHSGNRYSSRARSRSPFNSTLGTLTSSAPAVSVTHPDRPPKIVAFTCHSEIIYNEDGRESIVDSSGFPFFTTTQRGKPLICYVYHPHTKRFCDSAHESVLNKVREFGNVTVDNIEKALCETRFDPRLPEHHNYRRPIAASCKFLYHPPDRKFQDMSLFLQGEHLFDKEGTFYMNDEGRIASANEFFGLEQVRQDIYPEEYILDAPESDKQLIKEIADNEKKELDTRRKELKLLDNKLDQLHSMRNTDNVVSQLELAEKIRELNIIIKALEISIQAKRKQIAKFETHYLNRPMASSSIRYNAANIARFGNEIKFSQLCTIAKEGGFFIPGYDYFIIFGCRVRSGGIKVSSVSPERPPGVNSQGGGGNKSILIPAHKHNIRKKSRISRKYKYIRHIKKRKLTRHIRYKNIYKNRTRRYKK